ncbi:protein-(glutamine-N5) methyltransferase, release factor-specific [Candidatus Peribacteria bacterium RIFCSPHIGHO2_02_FULL_49_16]|nr:MAG: protein-(glutamine-N5) methyltransferase, release factor-specific [Candidatus Peribacteria bacterium RIFCSPHIGHO2_01_FULL_49_38]OGJ58953.1 MAG: protein-(glutamine-N5) methyltransferase, release factor-specific [Candidatus Peribacteria bacterium RIFCSPHIGHO2_02_FULL_49_16]
MHHVLYHTAMRIEQGVKQSGIATEDCEVLLVHILHKDRSWILAHPEHALTSDQQQLFAEWITRRSGGEPVAYITGEKEFYGRMFDVDPRVLIPRPSTEGLIDLTLEILHPSQSPRSANTFHCRFIDSEIIGIAHLFVRSPTSSGSVQPILIDVGSGSGCIAVTLACERPDVNIIATDISHDALIVAQKNAQKHGVDRRIDFRQGSLLDPMMDLDMPFLIISNPPYIPDDENVSPDIKNYEPHGALFGGNAGTYILKNLIKKAQKHPFCLGIIIECRHDQKEFAMDKLSQME